MQELGGDVLKVSHIYGQVAAQQAINDWQDETNKILFGDPSTPGDVGYYGLHGQAAMDARQGALQRMAQAREKYLSSLYTTDSQVQFNNETRYLAARQTAEIGRHYDQESTKWVGHVNTATYQNAIAGAALRPEDAENGSDMLGQATAARIRMLQNEGLVPTDPNALTPDQHALVARETRQAQIDVLEARIKALIPKNPDAASRLMEANRGILQAAPNYDALSNALKNQVRQANVSGAFDAIVNGREFVGGGGGNLSASGDLWSRIKGAEGGVGRGGEALVSPKGAIGVSQIIPSTAREMATDLGLPFDERRLHTDQAYNEQLGKGYLDKMLTRFGGNEALAAAAYNAGPERVETWLRTIGDPRKGEITDAEFARQIPIAETRAYTQKIIAGSPRESLGGATTQGSGGGGPAPGFDLAFGDSIAAQQIRHGVPGQEDAQNKGQPIAAGKTAGVGDTPQRALQRMQDAGSDAFAGKTVFLSPGTSNDPSQIDAIAEQANFLRLAGVRAAVIPGVGPGVANREQVNARLQQIANDNGLVFFEPNIRWQKDGVHPAEVDKLRDQARQALGNAGVTRASANENVRTPAEQFAADTVQPTGLGANGIIPVGATADQLVGQPAGPKAQAPGGVPLPLTDKVPRAPLIPPDTPNDRLQAFGKARQLVESGRLSPAEGEALERQLDAHYKRVDAAAEHDEKLAERNRRLMQGAISSDLFANAIEGKPLDDATMAQMVRDQRLTDTQYNAIRAEQLRRDNGRDDNDTALDLWRRAEANEDIGAVIMAERGKGNLSKATALELIKGNATRQREQTSQVERTNFAILKTLAGGDAVEKGLVDIGNTAHAAQIQLWTQAQSEWNRRVIVGKENPVSVLADMAPRYEHSVVDLRALPKPRMGSIANPDDIALVAEKTQQARDAGQLDDQQFRAEQELILRYKRIIDDQIARQEAAKKATQAAPAGGARQRGVKPTEAQ